jgi:uncharacterized protein
MLTADLLPVRRKNGELHLTAITGKVKEQHLELAEQVMTLVLDCEGTTREQLLADILSVGQTPTESKIVKGYAKLIEDALEFEADRGRGAASVREAVFDRAALAWKALEDGQHFDRERVLSDVAPTFERPWSEIEEELFIDLPGAQRVTKSVTWSAEALVERYEQGRILAILLRAASISATFEVGSASDVRMLFQALKFRRLLFTLEPGKNGKYTLNINGPYSLFDSVTKYGLKLALCWPLLALQSNLQLTADLRWGKTNEKLSFRFESKERKIAGKETATVLSAVSSDTRFDVGEDGSPSVSEESMQLKEELTRSISDGSVAFATQMLDLPGVGLVVPDLLCRFDDGTEVFVEVLGFWSRQAVWRRVELVEAGLVAPILFVVSSRLRVSEEVLDDASNSALYVYRGRINAVTVAGKLNELAARIRNSRHSKGKRRLK